MIYTTRDHFDAQRFARILLRRGYRKLPGGRRMVPAGTFRTRVDRRGRFAVVYTEQRARCSSPGHEAREAKGGKLCQACWARRKYRRCAAYRERARERARQWYARLTPEQRTERQTLQRVAKKLSRMAKQIAA